MEKAGFTEINRSLYYKPEGESDIGIHLAPSEHVNKKELIRNKFN